VTLILSEAGNYGLMFAKVVSKVNLYEFETPLIPGCILLVQNTFGQGKVVATIKGLKNDKGVCRVCLFNNPASFTGESGVPYACVSSGLKTKLLLLLLIM
jgi:hypothetical protein